MTDPFKKQRYSSPSMPKSSPSHAANTLSTIEENTFNKYTTNTYSSVNIADAETKSSFYERNLSGEKDFYKYGDDKKQQQQMPLNQQTSDQAVFLKAHLETNKELIAQLKSNIELLFKASKYAFSHMPTHFKTFSIICFSLNSKNIRSICFISV